MWRSGLKRHSGNPEVVGSRPADGKNLAVGKTFSGWISKGFMRLATHLTTQVINRVPYDNVDCNVSDSACALADFIIMTLYTPTGVDLVYIDEQ